MNTSKKKIIFYIVAYAIWLIISVTIWISGLSAFIDDTSFLVWTVWGILCSIPIIFVIVKIAFQGAKEGAQKGANTYSGTIIGNRVFVRNHTIRGALINLVGAIIGCLLAGPILLLLYIIYNILKFIDMIKQLKNFTEEAI